MKLRLQTDYALRTLILLGHSRRKMTAAEIAGAYLISKDHLVKVIQQLSRLGYVRALPGRGGGVVLTQEASVIKVHDVIKAMEGATGILGCVHDSAFCPMEPGCQLRRVLMQAESAFYDALGTVSIADLIRGRNKGGIVNLEFNS
jgi:Rrf2 family nitric oxide-sensitive transcriptional repressor